jgi:predicted sugar kinase
MSLKHRLPELEASIDPAALRVAADEYSDLLLTFTRANVRACATELKKRLTTWHSQKELNAILSSWDPVGYVLGLRREANDNARAAGDPVDVFV